MAGPAAALGAIFLITAQPGVAQDSVFTGSERAAIVSYWSPPERYAVTASARFTDAPWQVRPTSEGSAWLLRYQRAIVGAKVSPSADPATQSGGQNRWKSWVLARTASDRRQAQQNAFRLNAAVNTSRTGVNSRVTVSLPSRRGAGRSRYPSGATPAPGDQPKAPGPIPAELEAIVGSPPEFATVATPLQYRVVFADGDSYIYEDHPIVSLTYGYYRFPQGVEDSGTPLADNQRTSIFSAAGLTDTQKQVMTAVSRLEGSFDAVNTYDTGFVSVGFLQFVTLDDGRHSLADVMYREKTDSPTDFERDFRRFGVDITTDRVLVVVDPATGAELTGTEAVRKTIDDKRLTAVFQRAGRSSSAFQVAQLRVAKENYWPEDDVISVTVSGMRLTGKVSDVIRSEAGLATIFDRKVNCGTIAPLADTVAAVMAKHNLVKLEDVCQYEREVITACRHRKDFLTDSTLGQPGP